MGGQKGAGMVEACHMSITVVPLMGHMACSSPTTPTPARTLTCGGLPARQEVGGEAWEGCSFHQPRHQAEVGGGELGELAQRVAFARFPLPRLNPSDGAGRHAS